SVRVRAFGELLRVLAVGAHAPNLHRAAAVADEHNRPLESGHVQLARSGRRDDGGGLLGLLLRLALLPLGDGGGLVAARIAHAAEPVAGGGKAGVGVDGGLLVALRGAALVGGAVPGAAAQHAHLPSSRAARVVGRAVGVVRLAVPVVAPLPDVAVHVVQAPAV